jgi:hypothetical protein
MIKSEWKRKKSNRPKVLSNGKVELTTLSRKEISFNNKFWRLRGKINY